VKSTVAWVCDPCGTECSDFTDGSKPHLTVTNRRDIRGSSPTRKYSCHASVYSGCSVVPCSSATRASMWSLLPSHLTSASSNRLAPLLHRGFGRGSKGRGGRPRVRLLGCNGHIWPLMQYRQIDPHRLAFIKPGGLTQPLPVVVTTGPGELSIW
jgi:hypothetical protein